MSCSLIFTGLAATGAAHEEVVQGGITLESDGIARSWCVGCQAGIRIFDDKEREEHED